MKSLVQRGGGALLLVVLRLAVQARAHTHQKTPQHREDAQQSVLAQHAPFERG